MSIPERFWDQNESTWFPFHWTPPGGGHRRLPICVQESWGTAMPLRLACAGLQCWRHMGKWKPTFWLQFAQTLAFLALCLWSSHFEDMKPKTFENFEKSIPEPSKIETWSFQNRGQEPPKSMSEPSETPFLKTFNLRRLKKASPLEKNAFWSQLGSKLEAQEVPKSRPNPEKIGVEKHHIFDIDFGRVQASFWVGFWKVF